MLPATYTPSPGFRTALDDFRDLVSSTHEVKLDSYDDLHAFSVNHMNDFWMTAWRFAGVKASVYPTKAVDERIPIDRFPRFFEDSKLNFAENMLSGDDDKLAVISMTEHDIWSPQKHTWKELRQLVGEYGSALRSSGLNEGDVVALIGSNCVRSLALLLATAAVGGIFASFATDLSEKALHDRLRQLSPCVIFAESSYSYNGKHIDISTKITNCANTIGDSVKSRLVVIGSTNSINRECTTFETFENFMATSRGSNLRYTQVPFNTPLLVMFSSGTTGEPKGIVHSHGALVLNGIKEHFLHNNFGPQDVHFHFSNIGWTLWNISIGAMFCKTNMVLYDGSPFYPSPLEFLKAIFANGVTGFGAGPRYFSELQRRGVRPKRYATKLHTIFSTGAVLTPGLALWLVEAFGPICQISFSGGTELCGSFLHGTRSLPSYPGEIAVKELGMDIDIFSPDGKPVPEGEDGELVCKKPFPNMPVMFWNDPERKRYRSSYFDIFPHVWTHGDLIRVNPVTKGIYVLGRSDGVLNPSGIRFGSSDIYNVLSAPQFTSSIFDALVVGQQRATTTYSDPTERILLFIRCSDVKGTDTLYPPRELVSLIREQIAKDLSRRHVPEYIFRVDEVPYNANGKKMEIQVKAVVNGGASAKAKMKLSVQELVMIGKFERFYDLETLISNSRREAAKI